MTTSWELYDLPAAQIARLIVNALDYGDFGLLRGMNSAEVVDFTTITLEDEDGRRLLITVEEQQ